MRHHFGRGSSAFTLIELLLVIAIIALLISILLPGLGHARKTSRATVCHAQLKQFGTALHNYASEHRDIASSFSWKPQGGSSRFTDLNGPTGNWVRSHGHQAVDIVRRMTGHGDGPGHSGHYVPITNRMVNRNFGHLPLADGGFFSQQLPEPITVCPEDRPAKIWQSTAHDVAAWSGSMPGLSQTGDPDPPSSLGFKRIMPFWCTYQFVPSSWSNERVRSPLRQGSGYAGAHLLYGYSPMQTELGNRKLSDVSFPSQKVWVFDLFDRHYYKRPIWHAYPIARQPLLLFDGSVQVRLTRDSNLGWNPVSPNGGPTVYTYQPHPHEPRTLSGNISDMVTGHFRWTRGGLRGVDFGGGEVRRY
jgi:prepilin-type N-terminal cleavage/methylation domain-containing protein